MPTASNDRQMAANLPGDLYEAWDEFVDALRTGTRLHKRDFVGAALLMFMHADRQAQTQSLAEIQRRYYSLSISEADAVATEMDDRLGRVSRGRRRAQKGTG